MIYWLDGKMSVIDFLLHWHWRTSQGTYTYFHLLASEAYRFSGSLVVNSSAEFQTKKNITKIRLQSNTLNGNMHFVFIEERNASDKYEDKYKPHHSTNKFPSSHWWEMWAT